MIKYLIKIVRKRDSSNKDNRPANLKRLKAAIKRNREWHEDLLYIDLSRNCPVCSQYGRKVYSVSGRNKKYPKLPYEIRKHGGFCPKCIMGISTYFEEISTHI